MRLNTIDKMINALETLQPEIKLNDSLIDFEICFLNKFCILYCLNSSLENIISLFGLKLLAIVATIFLPKEPVPPVIIILLLLKLLNLKDQ